MLSCGTTCSRIFFFNLHIILLRARDGLSDFAFAVANDIRLSDVVRFVLTMCLDDSPPNVSVFLFGGSGAAPCNFCILLTPSPLYRFLEWQISGWPLCIHTFYFLVFTYCFRGWWAVFNAHVKSQTLDTTLSLIVVLNRGPEAAPTSCTLWRIRLRIRIRIS